MKFRPATIEERRRFYAREFSLAQVRSFFKGYALPQLCALDAGTDTGIILDRKWRGFLFYIPFSELVEKIEEYVPEDVYYDRNVYRDPRRALKTLRLGQAAAEELVFDIDADNILCVHDRKNEFCESCLRKAYDAAVRMRKELQADFKQVCIVYSGEGYHVHVRDKRAYLLTRRERLVLNRRFCSFPIDPWVSGGNIHLIRMPYTLNGVVSRKVIPVSSFGHKGAVPGF